MKKIDWHGPYPDCDICKGKEKGRYDVPTVHGPWANICTPCLADNTNERLMKIGFDRRGTHG